MVRENMSARKHKVQSEIHLDVKNSKLFENRIEAADVDLTKDVDEAFFEASYELIHQLSKRDPFVTGKMKLYVDLLARMHSHYVAEASAHAAIRKKVQSADEKLALALKTTATSDAVMEHLRESLAEAWRTADAVHLREARMQGQLYNIAHQEENRKKPVEQPIGQQKELRIRSIVYRERDRLSAELADYQKRLELNREYSQSLEIIIGTHEETIIKMQNHVKMVESEKHKIERKQQALNDSFEERIQVQQKEILEGQNRLIGLQQLQNDLQMCLAASGKHKQVRDRLSHENYNLTKVLRRLEDERNRLINDKKLLEDTAERLRHERTDLEAINRAGARDAKKKADEVVLLERRFHQVAKKNTDLNDQLLVLQNKLMVMGKNLMVANNNVEEATRQKEEMKISREKVRRDVTRLNDIVAGLRHNMAILRNQMQNVQVDLIRANNSLDEKEGRLQKITREKLELVQEAQELNKRIETLEEVVQNKTERLAEIQESLQQKQQDFHKVKKQMELVHSEKMMLIKNLDVCSRDRQNLQGVTGKLTHQINQLTNELSMNERDITSLRNQIDQLNSSMKQKENEIHIKERLLHTTRNDLREMKLRLVQSQHTVDEDEKRFKHISCTLEEINKEKTLVGLQMVRRNDELLTLREKVAMMQFAIDSGTAQYNKRIEDIRLLKLEITNLSMSRECIRRAVDNTANLRHEIIRLERELNQERLRVTAYMEEMARPFRIHRWRILLGKDPRRYELIRKIQLLLKRNIRLNVERTNMEQRLHDSHQLYNTLKQQLKHMPDPGVAQALSDQQRINREQRRRVKALTAELRITEIDVKTRDCLIERYQQTLREQHENPQKEALQKNKCQCQEHRKLKDNAGMHLVSLEQCTKEVFQSSSSIVAYEIMSDYDRAK
ncbi:cilia- and flagella-associated protein 58 [Drosophila tropicalis]|uniref:cilia- and flagella-associated protein 58 n=1 Tax=Drosophila tropicalis TaxID=46794 RepID=UPI0035AB824C